ncbi:MAG: beta-ketoacyl-[acyl-carrier-protein] synthase II, partial [Puniceicoccales bacterium]|nr:beta-ketoacyl-[acyl-carrier-protein] synthase II [Puniceicoccales bacterium]
MATVREISAFGNRVVVTGIGLITPLGIGTDETWNNLIAGRSGISNVASFDATGYPCRVAGEIKNFNPLDFVSSKIAKRNDPYSLFALAAARFAIGDANLDFASVDRTRFGVIVGSGVGGMFT